MGKIDELIQKGLKDKAIMEASLAQAEEARKKKKRAKAEEMFKALFEQAEELAGLEYSIAEINNEWYAVIWEHDPGVAIGTNGWVYRLSWYFDGSRGEIVRLADCSSTSLAEVMAQVASMPPSLAQARKQQESFEEAQRRGFCPFSQEYCVGQRCQLWISSQGVNACAIKALATINK